MKKGWTTKKLASITAKITDGSHNPPKGGPESDFLMLSSKNVFDDDLHYEDPRFLTKEQFDQENKRTSVTAGDVLLTIVGTVGRSAVVPSDAPPITLQRSVAVIRPERATIAPRFLMYSFIEGSEELNAQARGVAQKGIYLGTLREYEVSFPPLPEQQWIVGILDEAFAGIATAKTNTEKNLQNARAIFESHLQSVFTQRGEGWVEKTIDEVCDIRGGGTPSKAVERYWQGKIPWVSPKDMKAEVVSDSIDHISMEAVQGSATSLIPEGAVLVVVRSGILARIVPIAVTGRELTINQDLKALCPKNIIESRFLYCLLESKMPLLLSMVSRGATVHRLMTDQIRSLICFLPPKANQQRIVAQVDSMREATQRLESIYQQKLTALEELKKSLLKQAFSGEL